MNALFMDDEFYGRGKKWVSFNYEAFVSFCKIFYIPHKFIGKIKEKGLASKVLNDYMRNDEIRDRMSNYQFVLNAENNTVLGVVSETYQRYYNDSLLKDIQNGFPNIYDEFDITESYCVNTKLYLRLLSHEIIAGKITGAGGIGEDISHIGLQVSNSLVGDSSINFKFFILRLVCANGLVVESFNNKGKVMHSGRRDTLNQRLKKAISPLLEELEIIPEILKTLSSIEYNPDTIVSLDGVDQIYSIIPLDKKIQEKRKRLDKKKRQEFDTKTIADYPFKYGGKYSKTVFISPYRDNQSMLDFINIFTEYANKKEHNLDRRLEIQQRTGDLVRWIIDNKEKMIETNRTQIGQIKFY